MYISVHVNLYPLLISLYIYLNSINIVQDIHKNIYMEVI